MRTSVRTFWGEHDRNCDKTSRFASLASEPPFSHPWGVLGVLVRDFVVIKSPLGLQLRDLPVEGVVGRMWEM